MEHWLVIDLEATTDEGGWPLRDMEIIEIGASLADADGHEITHFHRLVRPLRRPCLTSVCTGLTHIDQTPIHNARTVAQIWPSIHPLHQRQGAPPAGHSTR